MTSQEKVIRDQNNSNSSNLIVKFVRKTWNQGIQFVDRLIDLTFNKKLKKQQRQKQQNIPNEIQLQLTSISKPNTSRSIFKEFDQANKLHYQQKYAQKKRIPIKIHQNIINRDQLFKNNKDNTIIIEQTKSSQTGHNKSIFNQVFNQLTKKKTQKITIQKSKLAISRQEFIFVQSKPNQELKRKYFLVKNYQLNNQQKVIKTLNSQNQLQINNLFNKVNGLDKDRESFGIVNKQDKFQKYIKTNLSTVFQSSFQDKPSQIILNSANIHKTKGINKSSNSIDNQSFISKLNGQNKLQQQIINEKKQKDQLDVSKSNILQTKLQDVKLKNNPFAMSLLDKNNSNKSKVDLKSLINQKKNILFSNPTQKTSFIDQIKQKKQSQPYQQTYNSYDNNKTSKLNIKLNEKIDLVNKTNNKFANNLFNQQNKQKNSLNHFYNKTPNLFSSILKSNESIPKLNMTNVGDQKDLLQSKFLVNTSKNMLDIKSRQSIDSKHIQLNNQLNRASIHNQLNKTGINEEKKEISVVNQNNMFQLKKQSSQIFGGFNGSDVNKQANIMFGLNKPMNNMLMGPKTTNSIFGMAQTQNQSKPDRSYERRRNKKQQRIK